MDKVASTAEKKSVALPTTWQILWVLFPTLYWLLLGVVGILMGDTWMGVIVLAIAAWTALPGAWLIRARLLRLHYRTEADEWFDDAFGVITMILIAVAIGLNAAQHHYGWVLVGVIHAIWLACTSLPRLAGRVAGMRAPPSAS
jgi:hypothetical protein